MTSYSPLIGFRRIGKVEFIATEYNRSWNEQTHAWTAASGNSWFMVGSSSEDIVYTADLDMAPNL
jgi:hypothetical protein